jgi:hypothetical protein
MASPVQVKRVTFSCWKLSHLWLAHCLSENLQEKGGGRNPSPHPRVDKCRVPTFSQSRQPVTTAVHHILWGLRIKETGDKAVVFEAGWVESCKKPSVIISTSKPRQPAEVTC